MKSRITIGIDFDNGNQPVIQVISEHSEDVRDELVRAFQGTFGYNSSWCRVKYFPSDGARQMFIITPIKPKELEQEAKEMQFIYDELKDRDQFQVA